MRGIFKTGLNSLSQSLTVLPAPSGREPLARPEGLRFSWEVPTCLKRAGTLRWARGREGCSDSPLPTSGLHPPRNGKGAARPFQTPKRKSNRKKSSRFAQRFFLGSPFAAPQPLRRQLPKWGAGMAGTAHFAVPAEAFPRSGEGGALAPDEGADWQRFPAAPRLRRKRRCKCLFPLRPLP